MLIRRPRHTAAIACAREYDVSTTSTPLGPSRPDLLDPETRPYFLWWTDLTVADFRRKLTEGSVDDRAYWAGALLREPNTRDVWLFLSPAEVASLWSAMPRHLGKTRAMWAWLLDLPKLPRPPPEARHV